MVVIALYLVGVHPHVLRNFLTPCFMAASKAIFPAMFAGRI